MNRLFTLVVTLMVCVGVSARTVTDFFVLPKATSALRLLNTNTRLDMVDYFKSGMPHVSSNTMEGSARIVSADEQSIRFETTTDIACQLALLTAKSDTVLMLIETVHLPQADSRITFYDKHWTELKREVLSTPKLGDWLTETGKKERADVEAWLPFLLWQADYANGELTLTSTLDKYYVDEKDTANLEKWLLPQLTYSYTGKKFTRKK